MSEETNIKNAAVTEEAIREALRGVMDPELHLDVIALGFYRESSGNHGVFRWSVIVVQLVILLNKTVQFIAAGK